MKKIFLILVIIVFVIGAGLLTIASNNTSLDKNAREYFKMAKMYSQSNDNKNAIKYYSKVIELHPDYEPAYVGRAKAYGDMENYQGSLDDYEALKKLHPEDSILYFVTSLYRTNIKDLDGAIKDIDEAISMSKKPKAPYYAQKAWVYLEKKDYENAVSWAKKAMQLDPRDEYTLDLIATMAFENGKYEYVLEITNDCLKYGKTAKENYPLLLLRANALYHLGKKDEAIKQIDDVIKLAPNNEKYLLLKEKMVKGEEI